jgi:hypothetical protein
MGQPVRCRLEFKLVLMSSAILVSTNNQQFSKLVIQQSRTRLDLQNRVDKLMGRRTLNRRELRAEAEAAEAMGIGNGPDPRKPARSKSEPSLRPKPAAAPRMRVVWAVCDVGGRTVATFDYPNKDDAEALVARLKSQGKGTHFVRSLKEPIQRDDS